MTEELKNAKDITLENFKLRCLVYARPKKGKTTFACSAPKPFVATFDKGMISVMGQDVPYKEYESTGSFISDLNTWHKDPKCPYESIIIDSVSTLQELALKELIELNGRAGTSQGFIMDMGGKNKGASMHEFGVRIAWLVDLMNRIKQTKFNVILIAHEETVKDEMTGAIITRPLIAGEKLPYQLPLYFDEVYRIMVTIGESQDDLRYNLITKGDDSVVVGSRLNLPRIIDITLKRGEAPNGFQKVLEAIKNRGK